MDVVLQTDSRKPSVKHAILALYDEHGLVYPDTPTMALHRGRIDLLERHLQADPSLLTRTFTHREIYPAEMGCHDAIDATVGTPLGGTTLLHMCVDYDEMEIGALAPGPGHGPQRARPGGRRADSAATPPLFNAVVSQPNFWMNYQKRGPFVAPIDRAAAGARAPT